MTIQDLLDFGFKEWPISPERDRHDRQFQYCLRDERGKKLYVQVRFWQFSKYNHLSYLPDSFDAYCQFDMNGPRTFNVDMGVSDMTPRQVVDWFEALHDKLGCTHYELRDDIVDENGKTNSCLKCNRYLPPDEAVEPYLCPSCKYLADTGFKPVISKIRRRHR